jgi:hypothetical protein
MSYILDALQKADRDRRTARLPTIGTVHDGEQPRSRRWPWITALAVVVAVVTVSGVLLVRRAPAPTVTTSTASSVTSEPAPAVAPAPAITAMPAPPAPAPPATSPAQAPPAAPAITAPAPATAPAAIAPPRQVPDQPAPSPARRESPVVRKAETASLKLEVLIYSDVPAERVAYINGQRYVEGQSVDGRAVIEQIARDGVVLSAGGKRYLLKQQQP